MPVAFSLAIHNQKKSADVLHGKRKKAVDRITNILYNMSRA